MPHPTPDHPARPLSKQTGPRTPAGKAKSRMNASKHGLRAASAVLPWEDPDEYDQFRTDITASLAPDGAFEEELARRAAAELWRLRRTDIWEAARARLVADADPEKVNARLAKVDEEIGALRAELAAQQRDPAADPPLAARLGGLPDAAPVDPFEVDRLYEAWAARLPDPRAAPGLGGACERAGLPAEAAGEPYDWAGWTAGHARLVAAGLARALGMTPDGLLAALTEEWKAGLGDERARRRARRADLRRKIARLEGRKADLVADRASPEASRLDLLSRYQAAAQRGFDRALKALLTAQAARRARPNRRAG